MGGDDLRAEGRGYGVEVEFDAAVVHRHLAAFSRVTRVAHALTGGGGGEGLKSGWKEEHEAKAFALD
jgi:hypothetical protein